MWPTQNTESVNIEVCNSFSILIMCSAIEDPEVFASWPLLKLRFKICIYIYMKMWKYMIIYKYIYIYIYIYIYKCTNICIIIYKYIYENVQIGDEFYIYIYIIMSSCQHESHWPSPVTRLCRASLPTEGLQGYILYWHRAVVYRFLRVVLPLLVHMKGSTRVYGLWVSSFFSSCVPRVWFV